MSSLAHTDFVINAGTGGIGITRQWFQQISLGAIASADANAAAAAWRTLWQTVHSEIPIGGTVTCPPVSEIIEDTTGAPVSHVAITSVPSVVVGSSTSHWEAGNGARINWSTATVHNRRLIRGATFLIPLTIDAYDTFGDISASVAAGYQTGITTYLAAMASAGLHHIAWHRPPKGTFTGGVSGVVVAGVIAPGGRWLRSRRT